MQPRTKKILKITIELILIIGLFILFFLMIDFEEIATNFYRITLPVLLGLLCFQLAIQGIGTIHWAILIRQTGLKKNIFSIFMARISGFAVSYVTPSIYLGGEPVRASILSNGDIPYQNILATVVLDKYIELSTKLPAIIAGFALLLLLIQPELPLILLSSFFILAFTILFIFLLFKLFTDKNFINRFFQFILKPIFKIKPLLALKIMRVIKDFQRALSQIIKEKKAFYISSLLGFIVSIIQVFQTYYILAFLFPNGISHGLLLTYSFIIFFSSLFFGLVPLTPGNIGPVEFILGVSFKLFIVSFEEALSKALLYSIMLRMGQLITVGIGLLHLLFWRIFKKHAIKQENK